MHPFTLFRPNMIRSRVAGVLPLLFFVFVVGCQRHHCTDALSWGELAVPLYSYFSKEGEYYLNVSIGTPPRQFLLQLDTGSADLGIPKWGCKSCTRHANRRYVPSKSSTSAAVNTNRFLTAAGLASGSLQYILTHSG